MGIKNLYLHPETFQLLIEDEYYKKINMLKILKIIMIIFMNITKIIF